MEFSQSGTHHGAKSAAWCATRQNICWSAVRIDSVNVIDTAAGPRVHAVIQLGGLEPADVQVHLEPVGARVSERRHTNGHMSSMQSYDNGAFVFESAPLPRGDDGQMEWRMRVQARDSKDARPVECRVPLPRT